MNDVSNPLWGPEGAAHVYAHQKGASGDAILRLDRGLRQLDMLVGQQLDLHAAKLPGAGAAGGAAFGLHCFLGARFISGAEYILGLTGVTDYARNNPVDFIFTGEGRIDSQTLNGKLIQGVLALGRHHKIPVIAVCGQSDLARSVLRDHGFRDVLVASDPRKPLAHNMEHAATLVRDATREYLKALPKGTGSLNDQ